MHHDLLLLQTMANYTRRNLSQPAQEASMAFFKAWATMVRMFSTNASSALPCRSLQKRKVNASSRSIRFANVMSCPCRRSVLCLYTSAPRSSWRLPPGARA